MRQADDPLAQARVLRGAGQRPATIRAEPDGVTEAVQLIEQRGCIY